MIRWGIVGPGGIAGTFAEALGVVADGEIVAVSSRSRDRADAFADRFGIARRYDDVRALATDPDVDAVYVATPHSGHEGDTLAALAGGKHVLCEKPLALYRFQVHRMIDAARASGTFLMEAMWSRFLPTYRVLVDLLGSGRIGEPLLVEADFGARMDTGPEHRLRNRDLGGGALLDLGIYPLQLSCLVLGGVSRVVADGIIGRTGVDELVAAVLHHERGGIGVIKASLSTDLACTARIAGTEGIIELPARMHHPGSLTIVDGRGTEHIDTPFEHGFRFQIEEVHRCIAAGLVESPVMPLGESLALASVMDDIRAQLGVTYPTDPRRA